MRSTRTNPNIVWLAFWVALAIAGHFLIPTIGSRAIVDARRARDHAIAEAKAKSANDYNARLQEIRVQERDAVSRRKEEMDRALGGPVEAAFKEPAFSLVQALQSAADACAPTNTIAQVDVDRFTEFTVTITSGQPLATNEMIAFARAFLPKARDYVDSVRFSTRGKLIAELDREDIAFVSDWTTVADARIAMLLAREMPARVAEDAAEVKRFRQELELSQMLAAEPDIRAKASRADRGFRQVVQDAHENLGLAIDLTHRAARVTEVRSLGELDSLEKHIHKARENFKLAKEFWSDPLASWTKQLEKESITGVMREQLIQNFSAIFQTDAQKMKKVFEALDGQIESTAYLLRMLSNNAGKWQFLREEGYIRFVDLNFGRTFERARLQVQSDAEATQAALQAWNNSTSP